jgi:hypothetical protein
MPGHDFEVLTNDALREARRNERNVYGYLLSLLSNCRSLPHMRFEEQRGATYGQLAAIVHRVSMDLEEGEEWDSLAESIPLSDRHAGYILRKLKRRAA